MLVAGIKSRPLYPGFAPDRHCREHVFAIDGEGAQAVLDLFAAHGAQLSGRMTIVFADAAAGKSEYAARLDQLPVDVVHRMPTLGTAMQRLRAVLKASRMGTRIYAAGSETLIGLTVQIAQELGMDPQSVMTEHRGTLARRVQCVHCKGFTDNARTNIIQCAHCHANLLVRDHYSRRLAAFQGVCVDAEAPGELPEIVEIFK